nr:hypothetical protein [Rhodococcus qingshengii]
MTFSESLGESARGRFVCNRNPGDARHLVSCTLYEFCKFVRGSGYCSKSQIILSEDDDRERAVEVGDNAGKLLTVGISREILDIARQRQRSNFWTCTRREQRTGKLRRRRGETTEVNAISNCGDVDPDVAFAVR